jgi:hypothetical protein
MISKMREKNYRTTASSRRKNMSMQNDAKRNCKYVFVCGLARSGTSLLGRNIARLEDCTGFQNTGVYEDEGQFLQDVYLTASDYGGSSRCGFDPRAHRTETSSLLTPENLLMTRFLQAAFPNAYFVVIRRHPVPVSLAGQKWKVNVTSLRSMFEHWLHCHELFEQDKKYLKHIYELRYEDYVENSGKYHEEIAAFLGTRVPEPPNEDRFRVVAQWHNPTGLRVPERAMEGTSGAHNQKYLDRWRNLLTRSFFKNYYRYIARKYERRFAQYGYSLIEDTGLKKELLESGGKFSAALGALYCLCADSGAFLRRASVRSRWFIKRQTKAVLPEFVLARIRRARELRSQKSEVGRAAEH